jgi:DNA-3-methyladenine glycosylase II
VVEEPVVPFVIPSAEDGAVEEDPLIPAVLSFSFDQAKSHLISVDGRFQDLFDKMECKPYERLESVHPFRCVNFYLV